jgi:hypothetical protein
VTDGQLAAVANRLADSDFFVLSDK